MGTAGGLASDVGLAKARYLRVADSLRRQVEGLAPNSVLPTEHQLARRFDVSRVTIRRALGMLERSGLVSRQRGRGTIVSPEKVVRRLSPLHSFEEDLWDQGIQFETRVLEFERDAVGPDTALALLGVTPGNTVGHLSLLRVVDDRIVSHDRRYFSSALAARFDCARLAAQGVSEILAELAGSEITSVDWESEIISSSEDVARVLRITPGTLIVANTFTYHLADGSVSEAGVMSYRIDRCKFRFAERFVRPARRRAGETAPGAAGGVVPLHGRRPPRGPAAGRKTRI